tara:strand:+ start:2675 stop:2860 length:186 start_codon:yes stop_codon:yes gene_type:complete
MPECKHDPKVIHSFDYDGCGGFVVWCKKCGAYSIHDEYTHDELGKWEWSLPESQSKETSNG